VVNDKLYMQNPACMSENSFDTLISVADKSSWERWKQKTL